MDMINWLDNPSSTYVLIAYALAAFCLIGVLGLSIAQYRRAARQLKDLG